MSSEPISAGELAGEIALCRGAIIMQLVRLRELYEAEAGTNVARYRVARMACEVAREVLGGHDFSKLLEDIARADSMGAILDPTLYRSKIDALLEDRDVFSAALRFLGTWPKREART
jgi:hypothetical protein